MSFKIGDTVGDYQIIGLLGAGGMGKVYKVKNTISDRIDALKVLLPDLAEDPELADRFIREIKVLASLNHPNIAGLRTAFRLENQLLMVMEYVEGTTLDERTKAGPIPLQDAINYITQALSALGFAHKHGVIHRDIKPANMMLTPDNVIKLMDFGIAKTKTDKKLTQTGTTMGSLFYMSAEQVQGNELDGRSDLYSVGVSLYELVTGTRPFQGKSDFDIMVAQLQQTPMAPIQVMPGLPKALNDIIMISLEKEPAKRFQTAEAFAAALGSITHSLGATPARASAGIPLPAPGLPRAQGTGTAAMGSIPPAYNAAPAQGSATGLMSTPTAPPMAVGGSVSTPGGFIATGSLPTVMAPQPEAPAPPTPTFAPPTPPLMIPPPVPSHGVPPPQKTKSYTGLYMTLGALIVVAILAVAAIEGTRFLKARAGGDQSAQVSTTNSISVAPATSTPDASAQPQTGAPNSANPSTSPGAEAAQSIGAFGAAGNATPPPEASAASAGTIAALPSTQNPVNAGGNATYPSKKSPKSHNTPVNMAAGGGQYTPAPGGGGAGQVSSTAHGGGAGPVAQAPTGNSAANAQELAELEDLHTKLAVRALAENDSVENLRKQMSATGNNLRSDVSASQTRMKMYMDKFDAAMNAGDPVAARKYMGLAEHEVEHLEKFFGN
jgi:serine/threonine-protein kinase